MDLGHLNLSNDLRSRLELLLEALEEPVRIERLAGDASSRIFLRVSFQSEKSAIIMCYPDPTLGEEKSFIEVHAYLQKLEIPVPNILATPSGSGLMVLEDLGDDLLETATLIAGDTQKRFLYEQAVDLIIKMITRSEASSHKCLAHSLAFDFTKLSYEMDFFINHFVNGLLETQLSLDEEQRLRNNLYSVCSELANEPRFFVHRDYHSRNIMLQNDKLVMIDFQDARLGPIQYDLASLLRDSYVRLEDSMIDFLINVFFRETRHLTNFSEKHFRTVFCSMAFQRNIKALGTFGYQTKVIGSQRYKSSILQTISYIENNLVTNPHINPDPQLLFDLVINPSKSSF